MDLLRELREAAENWQGGVEVRTITSPPVFNGEMIIELGFLDYLDDPPAHSARGTEGTV